MFFRVSCSQIFQTITVSQNHQKVMTNTHYNIFVLADVPDRLTSVMVTVEDRGTSSFVLSRFWWGYFFWMRGLEHLS